MYCPGVAACCRARSQFLSDQFYNIRGRQVRKDRRGVRHDPPTANQGGAFNRNRC